MNGPMPMTADEMRSARDRLGSIVHAAIDDFELATGLRVERIDLRRLATYGGRDALAEVQVDARL